MLGMASGKVKAQFGTSTSAAESFGELEDQTLQLSKAIRRLSHELHPARLNHADLITVLRAHCNKFESATHIRTIFNAEGPANHLSPELSLNLYRIVQKALRNVANTPAPKRLRFRS
jgi:signal transduction histidine kinase